MSSRQTDAILEGVKDKLYSCVHNGQDMQMADLKKTITVCKLHYDTWVQSYKLEANQAAYAYTNLRDEIQDMDKQVKWYFELLDALVTVNG